MSKRYFPLHVLAVLGFLLLPSAFAAGDQPPLYNGIVLPDAFPPNTSNNPAYAGAVHDAINNRQPQPLPPWLNTRPAVIPINIGRQFFIPITSGSPGPANPDTTNREFLVDSMTNVTRTWHYGEYHDVGTGLFDPNVDSVLTFSDGVWWDPAINKYVLYTHDGPIIDGSMKLRAIVRYYSDDAIHWTKVNNDVTMTVSSPAFAVTNGTIMDCDSDTIWLDQDEANPAKRWKAFFMWKLKNSGVAAVSPDGNSFANGVNLGNIGNQDRTTIFMNPFRSPRVGVWSIRGGTSGQDRMRCYLERDPNVFCTTAEGGWPGGQPLWTGSDILDPNAYGSPPPTLYNLDCTPYESMMLGLFSVHAQTRENGASENRTDKVNQIFLGFSYDGWYFHRPVDPATGKHVPTCPVVPALGTAADPNNRSWAGSNVQSVVGSPLIVGPADNEQLYFYASGRGLSYSTKFCLGMRYMRRDGFCSMDAGSTEGTVVTHPVQVQRQVHVRQRRRPTAATSRLKCMDANRPGDLALLQGQLPGDRASTRP